MSVRAPDAGQPISEDEMRAFVGRRADYYLTQWSSQTMRANWGAFFFSGVWLLYRKMYLLSAVLFGFVLVESVIEDIIFIGILHHKEPPAILEPAVGLAVGIVCSSYGSLWYWKHTISKIRKLRSRGLSDQAYFDALARRGGTSVAGAISAFVVIVALVWIADAAMQSALDALNVLPG
jgi:hypothetical protein